MASVLTKAYRFYPQYLQPKRDFIYLSQNKPRPPPS